MSRNPKITTFQGKRGTWVTTKTGRRVFIEEDRIKTYLMWTNAEKSKTTVARLGTAAAVTGIAGGGLLASVCNHSLKKRGYLTLAKQVRQLGAVIAVAGIGTYIISAANRAKYARERLLED
ncbi:hypothetical protein DRH14_02650 [Candidatus Shapirobacteria bacterium]|nr:MAG: hypothetical protein DRH14_02650 [Candidatus Shapirobacteria bacterium]